MNFSGFFRSTRFRVLLCVIGLLTGVMLYSLHSAPRTDRLTQALETVISPVRKLSAAVSENVSEKLDTYYESKAYRMENVRLRRQISLLSDQLIGYDDALHELEALRDQLGIKEKADDFVLSSPCNIRMPLTNDLTAGFYIDQGEEDGITVASPVICSLGLIGAVTSVSAHSAEVTTLLSPELSVGAVVLETGDSGIVEGDLRLAPDGRARMIYIDEKSTVKPGDLVITAGTTGLFPYGLQIGSVTEAALEESGLAKYAIVAPAVDVTQLDTVTVLLDFEGKGDPFGG